jgi:polyisoprenyl-teichoic acid--peptidoglycan teichoic acid transferase
VTPTHQPARRSASVAAFLSFIVPGLGQMWVGAVTRGILLIVPIVILVGGLAGFVIGEGSARFLGLALQPSALLAILALDLVVLVYRLLAIVDAYRLGRRQTLPETRRGRTTASLSVLVMLLIATLAMHGWIGLVTYKSYDLVANVFVPPFAPQPTPEPSPGGTQQPGVSPTPTTGPLPAWAQNGRLDVMLIGGDAGPGRRSLRTDSMTLVSVEIATGKAKMFGIPRNLFNVPLPPETAAAFSCGCFPDLFNALFEYAETRPDIFPGADGQRGYQAVQSALTTFLGVPIDGMLVVDLNGFVRLVDALGGLDIVTPAAVHDNMYPLEDGSGYVTLDIPAGPHHFDGHQALQYARTRHQDDDYHRMERQQLTLLALRRQINPCSLIPRLPELLDIGKDSLWTDLPIDQLPDLLALAQRVDTTKIKRAAFNPPEIPESLGPAAVAQVQKMVADAFKSGGRAASPTPTPSQPPSSC